MKLMKVLSILLVCLFFFGCNNYDEFKEVPYKGQLEGKFIEISYSRINGFSGKGSSLTFQDDGKVISQVYENIYSHDTINKESQISREKLENLAFQIQENKYFELEDSYDCRTQNPKDCLTDQDETEFKVTIGDKTKTVKEYDDHGPKVLRHIQNLLTEYAS